jgi:hypothetical protein
MLKLDSLLAFVTTAEAGSISAELERNVGAKGLGVDCALACCFRDAALLGELTRG